MIIEPGCSISIYYFTSFIVDGNDNKKIVSIDTINKTCTCYKEDSNGDIAIVDEDIDTETFSYTKIEAFSPEGMKLVLE